MKRLLKIFLYVVLPLAAAVAAVVGSGWLWSWKAPLDPATLPGTMTLSPDRAAAPGRAVTAELRLKLPVRFDIAELAVEPGKSSVVSGEAVSSSGWRWSHRQWRIAVTLRGLRTGEIPPGKVTATLRRRGGGSSEKLAFEIPGFAVGESDTAGSELRTAAPEKIAAPGSRFRRFRWLLVIPAALLAWLYLRRRRDRAARELPPWERAHAELAALDAGARGGKVAPESGIGRLTDIVRSYLEERFHLPASSRTTPEFLAGLDADGTPLDRSDCEFLRGFMNEADLVKFARADASCDALVSAIGKADALVENTTPHEEPEIRKAAK